MDNKLRIEINQMHAQFCSGLADPSRILILYSLADEQTNVSDLAESLNIPQPTVSRHLKVLKDRGMVTSHREGQAVYYEVSDKRIIDALDLLREILADQLKSQGVLGQSAIQALAESD